ncbi:MAG TPA: RtcB family protein, partial [Polyangiaceae bacterium]|nr:RtcB family protein [Polyangiaceae bacterium]
LVPGDMGRYSYVVVGTQQALHDTWGSACHGAGRVLSRQAALKMSKKKKIFETLQAKGVWVRALSKRTVAEEIPEAYKDVADVVDVMTRAGLVRPVVKLEPLAVIKG